MQLEILRPSGTQMETPEYSAFSVDTTAPIALPLWRATAFGSSNEPYDWIQVALWRQQHMQSKPTITQVRPTDMGEQIAPPPSRGKHRPRKALRLPENHNPVSSRPPLIVTVNLTIAIDRYTAILLNPSYDWYPSFNTVHVPFSFAI